MKLFRSISILILVGLGYFFYISSVIPNSPKTVITYKPTTTKTVSIDSAQKINTTTDTEQNKSQQLQKTEPQQPMQAPAQPAQQNTEDPDVKAAKQFWIDQLGINPFENFTPPINFNVALPAADENDDTLGQTLTYHDSFPLSENYKIAHIDINDAQIKADGFSRESVIAHELGHYLGLQHLDQDGNIMNPQANKMSFSITPDQKQQIINNYNLGH